MCWCMAAAGAAEAGAAKVSKPRNQGSIAAGFNSNWSACPKGMAAPAIVSPSKLDGGVFVGKFRSKLGPYQVRWCPMLQCACYNVPL
jgi:hypothetical protein